MLDSAMSAEVLDERLHLQIYALSIKNFFTKLVYNLSLMFAIFWKLYWLYALYKKDT